MSTAKLIIHSIYGFYWKSKVKSIFYALPFDLKPRRKKIGPRRLLTNSDSVEFSYSLQWHTISMLNLEYLKISGKDHSSNSWLELSFSFTLYLVPSISHFEVQWSITSV